MENVSRLEQPDAADHHPTRWHKMERAFFKTSNQTTAPDQIVIETDWTDYMQRLVDFGNKHYLRNFSLKLEMECNDGTTMI